MRLRVDKDDDALYFRLNESAIVLLQSHRRIFVSSQSFILAVGAIVARERMPVISVVVALLALYMIWGMWFPIVRSRHRIVDFYKFDIIARPRITEVKLMRVFA